MVEEAGQVLEAHILASLVDSGSPLSQFTYSQPLTDKTQSSTSFASGTPNN